MKKIITALLISASFAAHALSGAEFVRYAEDKYDYAAGIALGYANGLLDGFDEMYFCFPAGVTMGQARDVMVKYIKDNPATSHERAKDLAIRAFQKAWPCSKK